MDQAEFRDTSSTHHHRRLMFDPNTLDDLQSRSYLTYQHLLASSDGDQFRALAESLDTQQARQILYHARNGLPRPSCVCGQALAWHSDQRRYRDYCSRACTARHSVASKKIKNLATLGMEWHTQGEAWRQKVRDTSRARFGADHYSQTPEFRDRTARTCLERFGVERPAQCASVQEKMRHTNLARYGVINAAQDPSVKLRQQLTNLERYGVTSAAARHISPAARDFLDDADALERALQHQSVREIADDLGISVRPLYDRVRAWNITLPTWLTSSMERQVRDFVVQHHDGKLVLNDRSLLTGREIDIWLPDLNLAIECNGTYWHCENQGRDPHYHLHKTQRCLERGIDLLHIWEHDWIHRRPIVESSLMYRLGTCASQPARKLRVSDISAAQCRDFMERNHLQGWAAGAQVCVALLDQQGSVVSAMSLGRDRFGKTHSWEMLRFASVLCYAVPGAASKLFRYFVSRHGPDRVISYSDRATTKGSVYEKLGFRLDHHSRPNYRYTQDYMKFYSRNRFQKHRLSKLLKKFDSALTEWQNMQSNGWDRLWDCGNAVYVWTRS